MSEKQSFFTTLPGILSSLAALITAVGGLLFALHETGFIGGKQAAGDTGTASTTVGSTETTDGWTIIGKAKRGRFYDMNILIEGDSPAIGKSYKATEDFRLVAKNPLDSQGGGQVVTLGMVRRGDTVMVIDLQVPTPSTEEVFVYAKLRAVLDRRGD